MNRTVKLFLSLLFSCSFFALQASETNQFPTPTDEPAYLTTLSKKSMPLFSPKIVHTLKSAASSAPSTIVSLFNFAKNNWLLGLAIVGAYTLVSSMYKPTKNFLANIFWNSSMTPSEKALLRKIDDLQKKVDALGNAQKESAAKAEADKKSALQAKLAKLESTLEGLQESSVVSAVATAEVATSTDQALDVADAGAGANSANVPA